MTTMKRAIYVQSRGKNQDGAEQEVLASVIDVSEEKATKVICPMLPSIEFLL